MSAGKDVRCNIQGLFIIELFLQKGQQYRRLGRYIRATGEFGKRSQQQLWTSPEPKHVPQTWRSSSWFHIPRTRLLQLQQLKALVESHLPSAGQWTKTSGLMVHIYMCVCDICMQRVPYIYIYILYYIYICSQPPQDLPRGASASNG